MTESGKPRVVRKRLADGTIREYRYARARATKTIPNSVAALIRAYEESPEYSKFAKSTVENNVRYLKPMVAYASVSVADIRRRHLLSLRDALAAHRGHGAATQFCRCVSGLFSWAVDREWLESSPATRLRKGLNAGKLPTWTAKQAEVALGSLPEPYRRAVFLALHTGQRRGDLCAMTWSAYDGQRINIVQQKTKRAVSIPVVPELRVELDRWKMEKRAVTILETVRGLSWIPSYLSRFLPGELVKLGLPKGLNVHGLRKLAAVRLAQAGCSTHEIAAITGHKTLAMVQLYTEDASQRTLSDAAVVKLLDVNRPKKLTKT